MYHQERKKLHNLVLELKGNIRVFVRVSWPWSRRTVGVGCWTVGREGDVVGLVFLDVSEEIHSRGMLGISKRIYEDVGVTVVLLYIFV